MPKHSKLVADIVGRIEVCVIGVTAMRTSEGMTLTATTQATARAILAGIARVNYLRFLGYELIAALLWNIVYCLLGYFIAVEFEQLHRLFERTTWILLGVLLVALIAWRVWRWRIKQHVRQKYARR